MALEKYKVCPSCGAHNPPSLLECRECETDLTGVKPVDAETEVKAEETFPVGLVRVCECEAHNPPQARKCSACGEDISDILPAEAEQPKPPVFLLTAADGSASLEFDSTTIIGREAALQQYLSDKTYVSRQHARLTVTAGKAFIENLSRTNRTYLNNILIENDVPIALHEGDEIGLGGVIVNGSRQDKAAYFIYGVKP